ncbi:major capsid protein [Xanthomonas sacchari]|nr:major capsid protein [Xanthomonas sacchari]UYK82304.1 major capsid protein [Xanthomonas sacchari]
MNTNGLPRYAKQYQSPNGKGRSLEAQMNALSYCVRPKALIKGKRT